MTLAIKTELLGKRFEQLWAVKDLNLEIPYGQLFCFLGPNGAGKTTTIKLLAGLLYPTTGKALIGGYDIQEQPEKAKSLVGFVPDHPYLYEKLSGREFFHFVGDLFKVPHALQRERLDHFFELFGLNSQRDQLIEHYSHGMRQRLIISASLMHEPQIILIDEPMVGLDPRSARLVKSLFREQAQQGKTVFLSTHTLAVAEEIADRIGIIHKGELLFIGNLAELRERLRTDGSLEELFLQLTEEEE